MLESVLPIYKDVFTENLPSGLPQQRDFDYTIETDPQAKPPQRVLFQVSPSKSLARNEYLIDILKKKIRKSKSPFGANLFFVNDK